MQEKRISLRKLAPDRYYCKELDVSIDKEKIGTGAEGNWQRTEWGMAIGDTFVYAQRLGDCRQFLETIFEKACQRTATQRSRNQLKLERVDRRRWRTGDGIEVWSERRMLPTGNVQVSRVFVDLAPGDACVPPVQVGSSVEDAKRFIAVIPWRAGPNTDSN